MIKTNLAQTSGCSPPEGGQLNAACTTGTSPPTSKYTPCKTQGCPRYASVKGLCVHCSRLSPEKRVPPTLAEVSQPKSGIYAVNDSLIEDLIEADRLKVQILNGTVVIFLDGTKRKLGITSTGYACLNVGNWRKSRKYKLAVHRIVYRYFVGSLDPDKVINHKDGNPLNNVPDNLELISQSENLTHRFRVLKRPAVKGNASITQEVADQIRADSASGLTYRELIRKYGLAKSTISYIVNRKTWA